MRIALLLGTGDYANLLQTELRDTGRAHYSISLLPDGYSTVSARADLTIGHWAFQEVFDALAEQNITHVVFGGDFRFFVESAHRRPVWFVIEATQNVIAAAHTFSVRLVEDRPFRDTLGGWMSNLSVAGALKTFHGLIASAGYQSVLASDLIEELRPGAPGCLAHFGRASALDSAEFNALVDHVHSRAIRRLRAQSLFGIRQASMFEGFGFRGTETRGTDALLRRWRGREKKESIRTLVKLPPPGLDHRIDPPVLGARTIEAAIHAGVDLVIIDAARSILLDRGLVLQHCEEAGITLVAYDAANSAARLVA